MKPPVEDIISLLYNASEEILKIYRLSLVTVREKEDKTPVTDADTVSNAFLTDGLQRLTPHIPLIAEESPELPYEIRKLWTFCWLLDPLDGTREFLNRNGEFTINLALICDGTPYWGIIYQPVTGECWYGGAEEGSFHRNAYGDVTRLKKALHYSNLKSIKVLTSRSHINEHTSTFIKSLGDNLRGETRHPYLSADGQRITFEVNQQGQWDVVVYSRSGQPLFGAVF